MNSYTKLWHDIVTSSLWTTADQVTKVVWITMLALKDRDHVVAASIPGLARTAGVTIDECKNALKILSSPDEYSRTEDLEGRRIIDVDGGWLIVNGDKFQNRICAEERKEYLRIKKREERARLKQGVNRSVDSQQMSSNVNSGQPGSTPVTVPVTVPVAVANSTVAANKDSKVHLPGGVGSSPLAHQTQPKGKTKRFIKPSLEEWFEYAQEIKYPEFQAESLWNYYESKGWKIKGDSMVSWRHAMRNGKLRWQERGSPQPPLKNDPLSPPRLGPNI